MMKSIKLCPKDNKYHSIGDCYGGDCSNEQFAKCYPFEKTHEEILLPVHIAKSR